MFSNIFILSGIVLLAIDFIYLSLTKTYFAKQVQLIQGSSMELNYLGAAICYMFLVFGLNYFIIQPERSVFDAFLFGIIIYGTFDFTNMAIFKKWSLTTSIMDTLWGGTLFALSTFVINKIKKLL
jgi:uncharacterized membrane protein